MAIILTFKVEYEVTDEIELRASAVAAGGAANQNSSDALVWLLLLGMRERLTLPGARVRGATVDRADYLDNKGSEDPR